MKVKTEYNLQFRKNKGKLQGRIKELPNIIQTGNTKKEIAEKIKNRLALIFQYVDKENKEVIDKIV